MAGRQYIGETAAAHCEEVAGAERVHAGSGEVALTADHGVAPLGDQRARTLRADARDPQQQLIGRRLHLEGEALGVGEGPGRFRVVVEREVAVALEEPLVPREAVLPEQVLGLIEPQLARRRGGLVSLHRSSGDRLERAEVGVVQESAPHETRDEAEDLAVSLAGRSHDELGRRSGRAAALPQETSRELQLGQEIAA